MIIELKRELMQLQAGYKMGMHENAQLKNDIQLLEQRNQLETNMQEQLKEQMQEMRDRISYQD